MHRKTGVVFYTMYTCVGTISSSDNNEMMTIVISATVLLLHITYVYMYTTTCRKCYGHPAKSFPKLISLISGRLRIGYVLEQCACAHMPRVDQNRPFRVPHILKVKMVLAVVAIIILILVASPCMHIATSTIVLIYHHWHFLLFQVH